jgi:hypothetical protein
MLERRSRAPRVRVLVVSVCGVAALLAAGASVSAHDTGTERITGVSASRSM